MTFQAGTAYNMADGHNIWFRESALESGDLRPRQHRRPARGVAALRLAGVCREAGLRSREGVPRLRVSGRKARRPGLDALIGDARRKKFSVVLVAAFDRVARSVKHFLQVMDEFDALGITFISRRENVDTSGPMGRLFLTLIGSIAELESDLSRERVLAGMRRAKLDGVRIGRTPMKLDRAAIVRDRLSGMTLTVVAKRWGISRSLVCKLVKRAGAGDEGSMLQPSCAIDSARVTQSSSAKASW